MLSEYYTTVLHSVLVTLIVEVQHIKSHTCYHYLYNTGQSSVCLNFIPCFSLCFPNMLLHVSLVQSLLVITTINIMHPDQSNK